MEKWKKSTLYYPVRLFLKPINLFVLFIIVNTLMPEPCGFPVNNYWGHYVEYLF